MKALFANPRIRWWRHAWGILAVALVAHLGTVWVAPRAIMWMVGKKMNALSSGQVLHAPPVTAQSRSIVMPSPDMLYSTCTFDLTQGPLHITANPQLGSYWSIALYAANSDNFFVRNDQQAGGAPVDILLVPAGTTAKGSFQTVASPTLTGVLLMRVLTGNYAAEKAVLEPARRTLACTRLATAGAKAP